MSRTPRTTGYHSLVVTTDPLVVLAVLRREADVPLVLAVVTGGVRAEEGDISLTRPNVVAFFPQAQ